MRLLSCICPLFLCVINTPVASKNVEAEYQALSATSFDSILSDDSITDALIVRVKDERKSYSAKEFKAEVDCREVTEIYHRDGKKILSLRVPSFSKAETIRGIYKLLKRNDVVYAEPDMAVNWYDTLPEEIDSQYSNGFWYMEKIRAAKAWDIKNASSVPVGIIDTGIRTNHVEFTNRIDSSLCGNALNNRPYDSPVQNHGTMVAGVIGAIGNNLTSSNQSSAASAGICYGGISLGIIRADYLDEFIDPNISIPTTSAEYSSSLIITDHPVYTNNHESVATIVTSLEIASDKGFSVVNYSGGFQGYPSQSLKDAVDGFGGLLVCAAGNEGVNFDNCQPSQLVYPGCYPNENILSVSASDECDDICDFSCYGSSHCDVFAPGIHMNAPTFIEGSSINGTSVTFGGTSAAAPIVTGIAALMKSIKPALTPTQIKNVIINTADHRPSFSGHCVANGRVNALKALLGIYPALDLNQAPCSVNALNYMTMYSTEWFRVQAQPGTYYLESTGNCNTTGTLYDEDGETVIASASTGGTGNNFKMMVSFDSAKTCYMKVRNNGFMSSYVTLSATPGHVHDYTSSYSWKNNTKHYAYCSCGLSSIQGHAVSYANLHLCILCGGYASTGLIVDSIGGPQIERGSRAVGNDSILVENGILILGPVDLALLQSGLATYNEIVGRVRT